MSFTLAIKNAPSGSKYWWTEYSQGSVYSGWLDISQTWNCPYGAYGATDLHIWVVDSNYNTKHDKYNLGPISDDKNYIYDCSTGILSKAGAEPIGGWEILRTIDLTLTPSEVIVGGWNVLKTIDLTLTPSEVVVGGWNVLKTIDITLAPSGVIVGGWNVLKTIDIILAPSGVPITCSVDADCPAGYICKDGKCVVKPFDWKWVAIGGAAVAALILLVPTKKKEEIKKKPKKT